jgi:L-serine dehydratase
MAVSVFDLFKIGIGPSSSHTVGPMRAAARFAERWLEEKGVLDRVARVQAELYGSLALTGRGHGTDKAVLLGLEGQHPDAVDPDRIPEMLERIRGSGRLCILGRHEIAFDEKRDLIFNKRQKLPFHTNGMRFSAFDAAGNELATRDYYSVGGGFVVNTDEAAEDRIVADTTEQPYAFSSGDQMLALCKQHNMTIAQLMMANESVWRPEAETRAGLLTIWQAMQDCVSRGLRSPGVLPGGLKVGRRAPAMLEDLRNQPEAALRDPLTILDWVNLYALAAWSPRRPTARPASCLPSATTTSASARRRTTTASSSTCSPPPPSASCTRKTPRSPAPKSAARAKSAWPARWPPAASPPRWAAT